MWCHDPLPKDWTFCGAIQTTPLSTSSSSSLSHFFSSSLYISDWGRMAPGLLIWRQAQCTLYTVHRTVLWAVQCTALSSPPLP